MTATIAPATHADAALAPTASKRRLGRGFGTLLVVETKVWLRDNAYFWIAFPTLILLLNMLMSPDLRQVAYGEGFESLVGHPVYGNAVVMLALPAFISMSMGMMTIANLPVLFGGFREKGIFKVFSASPMRPTSLFVAHAVISIAASLAGVILLVVVTAILFPIAMPQNLALTLAGFLLGVAALLAVGSLIASFVPKATMGTIVGNVVFFAFMFTSGAVGGAAAPGDAMYYVARATPMGAAAQIIQYGWIGGETFPWVQLLVLGAWTAVCAPLAAKLFRWR